MNLGRTLLPILFILGGCGLFDALNGDRIVLLNPNVGADPYADAFVVISK